MHCTTNKSLYQGFFIFKMDTLVFLRFSEERALRNKTQSFVADVCNVSTKTVGRWEKDTPIPSDKLSLLAGIGFDSNFIITGERVRSDSKTDQIKEGMLENDYFSGGYEDANPNKRIGSEKILKAIALLINNSQTIDVEDTIITKSELTNLGEKWWQAVQETSDEEQHAILTLVFSKVIAHFIERNTEKDESVTHGMQRLSNYINDRRSFLVAKNK